MARQRDYAAEYARTVEIAHERGFGSASEYKEANAGRNEIIQRGHDEVGGVSGETRHDYVVYMIDEYGYSLEEALAEMREEFGDS